MYGTCTCTCRVSTHSLHKRSNSIWTTLLKFTYQYKLPVNLKISTWAKLGDEASKHIDVKDKLWKFEALDSGCKTSYKSNCRYELAAGSHLRKKTNKRHQVENNEVHGWRSVGPEILVHVNVIEYTLGRMMNKCINTSIMRTVNYHEHYQFPLYLKKAEITVFKLFEIKARN